MEFEALVQQPESRRDEAWENLFLSQFPHTKVQLLGDQAKAGPDGFPYLFVRTDGEVKDEPVTEVLRWLSNKGIGLVVNPHKMIPDYVFTYGMIWNFVETGRFIEARINANTAGQVVYNADEKVIHGPPSEEYLPTYVRTVLREFLTAQGFAQPRVLVVSSPDFEKVDLILSADSLPGLAKADHPKMAEMLAWFLPLQHSLVLAEENGLPSFHSL